MNYSLPLKNKTAFITGAGSGIGRATAKLFAAQGCDLALFSKTESELQSLSDELQNLGRRLLLFAADVSDSHSVQKGIESTFSEFGKLDIVIANAGVNGVFAPIDKISPDDFLKTIRINLYGTFLTIHYATPYLKKQGGSIVITSSINGNRTFTLAGASAYSASKAAQVALSRMLAVELGPYKIRVNSVCPGLIATNIEKSTIREDTEGIIPKVEFPEGTMPLTGKRAGSAKQVADLILFLVSESASHISGTEVFIDGGQSLLQ